jgi:hypothetical protein
MMETSSTGIDGDQRLLAGEQMNRGALRFIFLVRDPDIMSDYRTLFNLLDHHPPDLPEGRASKVSSACKDVDHVGAVNDRSLRVLAVCARAVPVRGGCSARPRPG